MADLLVKLYDLPDPAAAYRRVEEANYRVARPLAPERSLVIDWVAKEFGTRWGDEVAMAFSGQPVRCFVASDRDSRIVGFACYDVTFKGFFGPSGVAENCRGYGIGTALLLRSLRAMADSGYAYAVIGCSGADDYYRETVGAVPIAGSDPGPYRNWLKE